MNYKSLKYLIFKGYSLDWVKSSFLNILCGLALICVAFYLSFTYSFMLSNISYVCFQLHFLVEEEELQVEVNIFSFKAIKPLTGLL